MLTLEENKKKRFFRRLWITRISAACKLNDTKYSTFMCALKKLNINLNRKTISQLAIENPDAFKQLCEKAKKSVA